MDSVAWLTQAARERAVVAEQSAHPRTHTHAAINDFWAAPRARAVYLCGSALRAVGSYSYYLTRSVRVLHTLRFFGEVCQTHHLSARLDERKGGGEAREDNSHDPPALLRSACHAVCVGSDLRVSVAILH